MSIKKINIKSVTYMYCIGRWKLFICYWNAPLAVFKIEMRHNFKFTSSLIFILFKIGLKSKYIYFGFYCNWQITELTLLRLYTNLKWKYWNTWYSTCMHSYIIQESSKCTYRITSYWFRISDEKKYDISK